MRACAAGRASGESDDLELELESFDQFLAHRLSGQGLGSDSRTTSSRSWSRGLSSSASLHEAEPAQVGWHSTKT